MSIKQPKPVGPTAFRGPHRRRYSVEQFALAYNVSRAKVVEWVEKGFLGCRKRGRRDEQSKQYVIREHNRLYFEKVNGCPSNPKTRLPLE